MQVYVVDFETGRPCCIWCRGLSPIFVKSMLSILVCKCERMENNFRSLLCKYILILNIHRYITTQIFQFVLLLLLLSFISSSPREELLSWLKYYVLSFPIDASLTLSNNKAALEKCWCTMYTIICINIIKHSDTRCGHTQPPKPLSATWRRNDGMNQHYLPLCHETSGYAANCIHMVTWNPMH